MAKLIKDGLLYDTDKATEMWRDNSNRQTRIYYKTVNGNYFCLYGKNKIIPMTEESIMDLLGEKAIDVYLLWFPSPEDA